MRLKVKTATEETEVEAVILQELLRANPAPIVLVTKEGEETISSSSAAALEVTADKVAEAYSPDGTDTEEEAELEEVVQSLATMVMGKRGWWWTWW